MNMRIHETFSQPFLRLPLRNSPHIHHGNALRMDWNELLPASDCSYILGNPPFVGKSLMDDGQKDDMQRVLREAGRIPGGGVLDYVTAWYLKAARYIHRTAIEVAFVSTNSIAQGEQPGVLWNYLFSQFHISINFAYQTFEWTSEARGRAHVHVVIIGFAEIVRDEKTIFLQDEDETTSTRVTNISPYLVEGGNITISKRARPISPVPECLYGNKPADGGFLILEDSEREEFMRNNPHAQQYIRPLICAEEYLNNQSRWCLWLVDADPSEIRLSPDLLLRIEGCRQFRIDSKKKATNKLALTPYLFAEIRQPQTTYICIPRHTSETRRYIPCGYLEPNYILHDSCTALPDANLYHFGCFSSTMHMAWVKLVAGRLESRFRYSNTLVYNNYPWPQNPSGSQRTNVERAAQAVLDARAGFPDSNLAALYDPSLMPPSLVRAHQQLDRAVERCYRPEPFPNDRVRVEYLFALYEQLTAPLLPAIPVRRRRS